MLKNYLTIALRTLRRHPGYTFINVAGLAVGIGCFLLILLYIQDELRFDRFHNKADSIYRIVETRTSPDQGERHFVYPMGPLAPTMVSDFPEVTNAVRMISRWTSGRRTVEHGPNRFYEAEYLFAEPSFFEIFDFEMLRGNPDTALNDPLTVVLTEAAVRQYFGEEDPFGQTLAMEQYGDLRVTGILRDPPKNSHLQFSMLISYATLEAIDGWLDWMLNWRSTGFITYVTLADGASPEAVEAKLQPLLLEHREEEQLTRTPYLQPLTSVHFQSDHIEFDRNAAKGDTAYLYIFLAIALFILLIACINYMNMATARSMRRAREVGLRKVVGAHRMQLIRQFLSESILTTLIALGLALGLVLLVLPAFNTLADKDLTFGLLFEGLFLPGLIVLMLIVGAVAGSYPAFYLSRLRPAVVLSGGGDATGAARLRRVLVVTQFALSIIMLVATVVVFRQLDYIQTKRLGFNQDHLVVIDINNGDVRRDWRTIKSALNEVPAVQQVSSTSRVPGDWKNLLQVEVLPENTPDTDRLTMYFMGIDEDFLDTYEVDLAAGRNFSLDFATDTTAILLNETAARMLGIDAPAEQTIRVPDLEFDARVIGIVDDFHFRSLHEEIGPLVLGYWSNPIQLIDYFTARIDGRALSATLDQLRAIGERFDPSHPFEYNFLDERLNDFYQTEQRVGTLFAIAALLAVLIACLGLFGLASFTAEQRTKEIGVRKVLGASVGGIVVLLSKDFLLLVGFAFILAAPMAYVSMDRWLNTFAYRVDLSWSIFLLAGSLALAIAMATVSYQSIRAALANPVKALRYE